MLFAALKYIVIEWRLYRAETVILTLTASWKWRHANIRSKSTIQRMYLSAAKPNVSAECGANNDFDAFSSHLNNLLITKLIYYPMQIRVVGNLIGDSVEFQMTAKDWYIPREHNPKTNNYRPVVIGSTNHLLE